MLVVLTLLLTAVGLVARGCLHRGTKRGVPAPAREQTMTQVPRVWSKQIKRMNHTDKPHLQSVSLRNPDLDASPPVDRPTGVTCGPARATTYFGATYQAETINGPSRTVAVATTVSMEATVNAAGSR